VFGPDGKLVAVLDVTSIDPDVSDRSHALALVVTIDSARAIEETLFRRRFRCKWNLVIAPPSRVGRALMLAVDADQRIVGADCNARSTLGLDDRRLATGVSLWTIFDRSPSLFRRSNVETTAQLIRNGDSQPWRVLITPPATNPATASQALLHARPRIGQLDQNFHQASDSRFRGGVASGVQRRVDEFVEANLDQSIELESMAVPAGLSLNDFAHALKHSLRVQQRGNALHRSIERAKESGSMSGTAAALSPRERYILELIGGGQSNKEIARALGIAPETVKSHVKNMFVKLSVERRAQAVYRAQSLGMMVTGYQVPPKRFDEVYQG
jgi:DNA-binding NarL/FixJ family response regulator